MSSHKKSPLLIDLFSGCGGFALGAHRAGFRVAAAFDNDPILSSSYPLNFPNTRFLLRDVAQLTGDTLRAEADGEICGIFGGPPCQGFSTIGKRDPRDPRRQLLGHFFRLVSEAQPTFFVMENVTGLCAPSSKGMLDDAMAQVEQDYFLLGPHIFDASEFGAATKRPRLFVIGIHKQKGNPVTLDDINSRKTLATTVEAAIRDLEGAVAEGESNGFDCWQINQTVSPSSYALKMQTSDLRFTGHRPTKHTEKVVERFARISPGSIDEIGRHPRLKWDGQCPTLRAGTGTDKGSYQAVRPIHPALPRVITVREAARLQGFPDNHLFHPTIWHSFRMIGNSVSPIIAEAIFTAIAAKLQMPNLDQTSSEKECGSLDSREAILADVQSGLEKYIGGNTCAPDSPLAGATL